MNVVRHSGIAAGFVSVALLASLALPALAEETSVGVSAEASVSGSTTKPLPPRPGFHPLQTFQTIKKDVLENRDADVKAHLNAIENSSTTVPGANGRIKSLQARDQNIQNRENKLDTRMAAEKSRMMDRVKMQITLMVKRHQTAIDRLTHMIDRSTSRIEKLKAKGVATTAAETALASATTELNAATADLADITAGVDAAIAAGANASTTPGSEPFKPLRDKLADSDKHIQAALGFIKTAVQDLIDAAQAAHVDANTEASSTVETH